MRVEIIKNLHKLFKHGWIGFEAKLSGLQNLERCHIIKHGDIMVIPVPRTSGP